MSLFIKARIAEIVIDQVKLELPDGKILNVNDHNHLCKPEMIDTVRSFLLSSIVGRADKLQTRSFGIILNQDGNLLKHIIRGQVSEVYQRNLLVECGYGFLVIETIEDASRYIVKGDFIKAEGNSANFNIRDLKD
jgi:hypothetical protein